MNDSHLDEQIPRLYRAAALGGHSRDDIQFWFSDSMVSLISFSFLVLVSMKHALELSRATSVFQLHLLPSCRRNDALHSELSAEWTLISIFIFPFLPLQGSFCES
jgi:hypothetical protein